MAKTIIYCADGTWNGPEDKTGVSVLNGDDHEGEIGDGYTNVLKLFGSLAGDVTLETRRLQDEQEKVLRNSSGDILQVSKYMHGVGDSRNPIKRLLGGTLGMGVVARIVRGYTFISRWYERGDRIHIVGFSRGAYTARALAGMIAQVGLLDRAHYNENIKLDAYRHGVAAWCKAKRMSLEAHNALGYWANIFLQFLQGMVGASIQDDNFVSNVPIESVAVWDTVGSMGIPEYAKDKRIDMLQFADKKLSAKVAHGFHAMAIDEMRIDFPVTRWDARDGVEEVWFVGAHSDVGGGYALRDSYLSNLALDWIMDRLAALGVGFSSRTPTPLPSREAIEGAVHTPWLEPPFHMLRKSARSVERGDLLHVTVTHRWDEASAAYRPDAMGAFHAQGLGGFTTVS